MPFHYHIRELTAKTTTAAFVERFVWVEKSSPLPPVRQLRYPLDLPAF